MVMVRVLVVMLAVAAAMGVLALIGAWAEGWGPHSRRQVTEARPPEWHEAMRELDELDGTRPPRMPDLEPPEPMVIQSRVNERIEVTSFDDETTVYLVNEPSYDHATRSAPRLTYQRPRDPGRRSQR